MRRLWGLVVLVAVGCTSPAPPVAQVGTPTPTPTPVSSPSPPAPPPLETPPPNESLREYVERTGGKWACSAHFAGAKIGYLVFSGTVQGQEAVESMEMAMTVKYMGDVKRMKEVQERRYALAGEGKVLGETSTTTEDGVVTKTTARPRGRGFEVVTSSQGDHRRRQVPVPRVTLKMSQDIDRWLASCTREGATRDSWELDWEKDPIDQKQTFRFLGRRTIVWAGVPVPVYEVEVKSEEGTFTVEVDSKFRPLKATMAGVIELRAVPEEEARREEETPDMLAASSIPVSGTFDPDAASVELLVEGPLELPQDHRQQLKGGHLTLRRDAPQGGSPTPLSAADRKRYLAGGTDPKLVALARKIVGEARTPLDKIRRLQSWVYKNLEKSYTSNASTPQQVLANRAGDCTEHALLVAALARAAGLPAREVAGLLYLDGTGLFGWHQWAEVYDGRRWVSVDAAWDQVYVSVGHIKLTNNGDDFNVFSVCGKLRFTVSPKG